MATLPKYILKGIKYELSDVFRKKQIIELPESFDLKDPEVILEDCEYDFSIERRLLSLHQGDKSSKTHNDSNKGMSMQNKPQPKQRSQILDQDTPINPKKKQAPRRPPQPKKQFQETKNTQEDVVSKAYRHDSPEKTLIKSAPPRPSRQIDRLPDTTQTSTLDDVSKERKHKATDKKSKSRSSASSSHVSHQQLDSGVDKYDQHDENVGVPQNKSKLLDQLTDLLTDDVKCTENA